MNVILNPSSPGFDVTAQIIDGKKVSKEILQRIARETAELKSSAGRVPG
ncbi:MAG: hypothetical protein HY579_11585, partial [Nitrospinae bacterium]|nr:hypothetical protein [Nitrospinota bacterium]